MSVQSEITRISGNVTAALAAITAKGGTVPAGAISDDLAAAIATIPAGYSWLEHHEFLVDTAPTTDGEYVILTGNSFLTTYYNNDNLMAAFFKNDTSSIAYNKVFAGFCANKTVGIANGYGSYIYAASTGGGAVSSTKKLCRQHGSAQSDAGIIVPESGKLSFDNVSGRYIATGKYDLFIWLAGGVAAT